MKAKGILKLAAISALITGTYPLPVTEIWAHTLAHVIIEHVLVCGRLGYLGYLG